MNAKTCKEKIKGYVSRFMDRKTCALLGATAVALAGEAYLMSGHEGKNSYLKIGAPSQNQPASVELQRQLAPTALKINDAEILGYKKPDDLGFYVITNDDKLTKLEAIAFSVSMTPGKTPDGKDSYTATLDYSKAKPIWKPE